MSQTNKKTPGASDTKEETVNKIPKTLIVDASTMDAMLIECDREGGVLQFDPKESFRALDDGTLAELSPDNKARYRVALDFNRAWQATRKREVAPGIMVDLQLSAQPGQKLEAKAPQGKDVRWVRPENILDRQAKGWKLAGSETTSYLGMTSGAHKIGINGQVELVAMIKDSGACKAAYKAKVAENEKRAGFKSRLEIPAGAGGAIREYDPEADHQERPWKELASMEAGEE